MVIVTTSMPTSTAASASRRAPRPRVKASIHNKTQWVADEDLPFNPANRLASESDLREVFARAGYAPPDSVFEPSALAVLQNAFIHKSYVLRKNESFEDGNARCPDDCVPLQPLAYERLEFLGDAILGGVVSKYLFRRYPGINCAEGFLSQMRTKLVNGNRLAELGNKLGLAELAVISKQLERAGGRRHVAVVEDIFEALIGALYVALTLLSGEDGVVADADAECTKFVVAVMEKHVDFVALVTADTNPKQRLATVLKRKTGAMPRYETTPVSGSAANANASDGESTVMVRVYGGDDSRAVLGFARGVIRAMSSEEDQKRLEYRAAENALRTL